MKTKVMVNGWRAVSVTSPETKQGWVDAKRHAKIQGCLAGAKLLDLCLRAGFLVILDKCHHDLAVLERSVFRISRIAL